MTMPYTRPSPTAGRLRLHLNENSAGCSQAALDAVRALSAQDIACYPDYDDVIAAVADTLAVPAESVLLTNGLDEAILATTAAAFRRRDGSIPEAVGVSPAFEMYEIVVDGLGGRMRLLPLDADFGWTASALAALCNESTRIVFVTNPHNPSGATVSRARLLDLAARVAPATLFVDEAYADFTGETLVDASLLRSYPHVIVGRTFSKAYGLAGLRIGALIAAPETLAPVRKVVPPFSVNSVAVAALAAALGDRSHVTSYIEESRESRRMLADACARIGLRTHAASANFMLVDAGALAQPLVNALAARGIIVRDKSTAPGCTGCIRMTAGRIADTSRLIAAMEDAWRELHG
jgi:histidinol-phosphate aminotransferase